MSLFLATEITLEVMKNSFYSKLKALIAYKILSFCTVFFGHVVE